MVMNKITQTHTQLSSAELDDTVRQHPLDFTRLLYMHHQEMDNHIRHADLKAQLTLGINAIFIAVGTTPIIDNTTRLINDQVTGMEQVIIFMNVAAIIALVTSVAFSLFTIMPRVRTNRRSKNLYFYGDIVNMSESEFIDSFMETPLNEVKIGILAQIHTKSFIVQRKFKGVRYSVIFLFVATVLWACSFVLPLFA